MDEILQEICDVSSVSIFVIMGLNLVLHIMSLKKWFQNRVKNEINLEMVQSLWTNNKKLADRIYTLKIKLAEKLIPLKRITLI